MRDDAPWTKSQAPLPSPDEANRIAAVTRRLVAASDGRSYSGATNAADPDPMRRRAATDVVGAINTLAECPPDPATWLGEVERHKLEYLSEVSIDLAIDWLTELRQKLWESRLRP